MSSGLAKVSSPGRFSAGRKNTWLTLGLELHRTQVSGRERGAGQQGWSWTETEEHACWKNLKLRRTVSSGSRMALMTLAGRPWSYWVKFTWPKSSHLRDFLFATLVVFFLSFFFFEKGQCLARTAVPELIYPFTSSQNFKLRRERGRKELDHYHFFPPNIRMFPDP